MKRVAQAGPWPTGPSVTYRAGVWNFGRLVVWLLPERMAGWACWALASLYCRLRPRRVEVAVRNLLPARGGQRAVAERAARALFQNFALKLADLWRFENGRPVSFQTWTGWEHLAEAQAQKRGLLLVTAHLGNWELGAPFLVERGIKLLVLTQAEPGNLTAMRQASRARWGIETLVVGEDAFAFVEVIKRLQAGAAVALLVDRPAPATAVEVTLFGRPFAASVAAADLARASGCSVLPVSVVRTEAGYHGEALAALPYDRQALGQREARRELTQAIIRALEPSIQRYAEQWYHFVPVWPDC